MDYIVFDLEFNQFYKTDESEEKRKENCPLEIIQIGAIKLDGNLREKSRFNALVKPQIYKEIHPYVERLTKINNVELQKANGFESVIKEFAKFIGDANNILGVWGMIDLQVLYRNITYYDLDLNLLPKGYINIQKYVSKLLEVPNKGNVGLENAVNLLNIERSESFHDALNDATYTSKIMKRVYSKNMTPEIYNYEKILRKDQEKTVKQVLNTKALIKQFEKMQGRDLSEEEIAMVVLAYKMGATHQFLMPEKPMEQEKDETI